jgi:hypothetical protein
MKLRPEAVFLVLAAAAPAWAQEQARAPADEELIQQLANPLAALLSVPVMNSFDFHVGPTREGFRHTLSVQPTLPLSIGENWNVISRTIVPLVYQEDVVPGAGDQYGLGDIVEAVYVASVEPGRNGYVWGVGPIARIPTGADDFLTQDQWQLGPTFAGVKQQDSFTFGVVGTHLWSVEGNPKRPEASLSTVEPFIDFTTGDLWTLSFHLPALYDWNAHEWTLPLTLSVKKLATFQSLPVHLSFGVRYWADGPETGPHDLGFLFGVTFVFPK